MSTRNFFVLKHSLLGRRKLFSATALLLSALLAPGLFGATIIWSGANDATDTNWSDSLNWVGAAAPGNADDVKFFNTGAASTIGITNNIADTGFGGTIGSLQYGSTNGFHTTYIAPGVTLMITNTGGIYVGTTADIAVADTNYATIAGANGTLIVSNASGVISLNQGTAQSVNFSQSILNLTNLGNFNATVNRIGLGTTTTINPANASQREAGSLYLAMTNNITVTYQVSSNVYLTLGSATNGIELQKNPGNNAGSTTPTTLYLGLTNTINADSIGVGRDKSDASCLGRILFNPIFTNNNPVAWFNGVSGPGSRVTWWAIGDGGGSSSSSHGGYATNDFTGGTINAFVNWMSLGRDCSPSSTWAGPNKGVLIFDSGTIDVNTLYVGNQVLGPSGSTTPNMGIIYVNGPAATLKVNDTLVLGNTTINSTAAANTSGTLQINGGTVLVNQVNVGAFGTIANTITVTNGTLNVSNTIASPSRSLTTFSLSGSTLQLNALNATTNVFAAGFSTAGANTINIGSAPIYSSYPTVVQLIKYTGTIGGSGYSALTLGSIPADAPGAFLSNDVANAAVDLVLPNNPVPVITFQPLPFSGSPGSTVTLSVTNTGNTPLSYQWYYANAISTNALVDGPGESGSSTLTGSLTNALTIQNAQADDSGSYFIIITNIYGAATSSVAPVTISSSPILPSISRLNNQTNIAGTTPIINPAVTGNPFPTLQWQFNGVNLTDGPGANGEIFSGSTTTTLSITNLQYPADQGTYSLIASNTAGAVTNTMFLTVIVAPGITNQPTSLVVTNTQAASFTVLASGIPSPTYQWYQNNNPISLAANSTATSPTLLIPHAAPTNTGTYFVQISNAAGTTNSTSVTLTVNSTMSTVAFSPANGATGVCYDTPFYVTFSSPVVMNNSGKIRICDTTNSTTPVDTIDLSQTIANGTQPRALFPGDSSSFNYYPIVINSNNNTVAIYPQASSGIMTSNQTYYLTIDDGAFSDTNGAFFAGVSATNAWQFNTKPGGPANPTNLVVAQDYSGDFATVQGALDSIPSNNVNYTLIYIKNGTYFEIVNTVTKNDVTFRGQNRNATIVGYPNNANIAPGGSTQSRMAFKVNSVNVAIENMTVTNMTAQGGSQAEALMINTAASRFILNNAEVDSRQDTILANVNSSQGYFYNSLIQGNYDYIWGGGNLFFTNCEIRTISGTASQNLAAPRTDNGPTGNWPGYNGLLVSNGFSFVCCMLTHQNSTVTNCSMSDANGELNGNAVWSLCSIDTSCYTNALAAALTTQLLWEYSCSNLNNTVVLNNSTTPFLGFTQLNNGDPRELAAASATNWLNGWQPQLAPNILTNPVSQTVGYSSNVTFTVVATGIPNPTYQWLLSGTNLPGATGASLTVPDATPTNAGSYSVIVTTPAGSVTSQAATLAVSPPQPFFVSPPSGTNIIINVGVNLVVSCTAVAADVPPQTLTYSLIAGPSGSAVNPVTGNFTWRPIVSQTNSTNTVSVVATDNDTSGLSATNTFTVTVNPLTAPTASSPGYSDGQFSVSVNGQVGPDYALQTTTNLANATWITVATTNSPATMPFTLTDMNASQPAQFYRIVTGPPFP